MLSWLLIHLNCGRPRSQLLVSAPPPSLHNAAATAPAAYTLNFLEAWEGLRWKIKGRRAQKRTKIACKRNCLTLRTLRRMTAFCAIKYGVLTFIWRYLPPKIPYPPPRSTASAPQKHAFRRPKGRLLRSKTRQTAMRKAAKCRPPVGKQHHRRSGLVINADIFQVTFCHSVHPNRHKNDLPVPHALRPTRQNFYRVKSACL